MYLGYVTDGEAKSLMENCKAFLFPTLYEGFGIPPLEAIACGAPRVMVSNTPCMREIYGSHADYIDLSTNHGSVDHVTPAGMPPPYCKILVGRQRPPHAGGAARAMTVTIPGDFDLQK